MTWPVILFGLFLGFALLSIIYNVSLFAAMREQFLIWHSARLALMIIMALVGTDLFFGDWLADMEHRRHMKLFLLDIAIAMTGPFLVAYLEKDMLGARLAKALNYSVILVMTASLLQFAMPDDPVGNTIRHLLFVGIIALNICGLVQGYVRGSRAARFQSVAWFLILIVSSIAVMHEIIWNSEWALWATAIMVALAFEVVVSAVGMSDRFMVLRRQRDEAISREILAEQAAAIDPLTGLPNRRGLKARLGNPDLPKPDAVAYVDLDHFKSINDKHGHDVGDKVLVVAASALVGENSFAARVGGEEFALLFFGENSIAQADHIRRRIANSVDSLVEDVATPVTASMGLCRLSDDISVVDALSKADKALYRAKRGGRDRLLVESGKIETQAARIPMAKVAA